ncbi:MAG: hypothetical protein AAFZ18_00220 [Myxococcota bacterium]
MGRRAAAITLFLTFLAGCPQNPIEGARRALERGDLDEAGETFLRVARADPAHLAAWDGAVEVWCRRKVAVARCLEVLDLELDFLGSIARHHDALAASLESRARARLESGLAKSALEDLERAEAAAPERASIHVVRARALGMLGQSEAARAALDRALTLDPHHREGRALLEDLSDEGASGDEARFGGETSP